MMTDALSAGRTGWTRWSGTTRVLRSGRCCWAQVRDVREAAGGGGADGGSGGAAGAVAWAGVRVLTGVEPR